MIDSTVTDSARISREWGQFKDYKPSTVQHPPGEPSRNAQVAGVVLEMCIMIAPVVLLAAIWSKLNEVLMELRARK